MDLFCFVFVVVVAVAVVFWGFFCVFCMQIVTKKKKKLKYPFEQPFKLPCVAKFGLHSDLNSEPLIP